MGVASFQRDWWILIRELAVAKAQGVAETQIKYYRGLEGLRQMLWNVVNIKSGSEFLGFGYMSWNESVGRRYAEKLRQIVLERNLYSREINNTVGPFIDGKPWTTVMGYMDHHQERILHKNTLEVNHDAYIFGDIFSFYYFYQKELFGIEIHNAEIAKTQKQIFEILWKMAKKVG